MIFLRSVFPASFSRDASPPCPPLSQPQVVSWYLKPTAKPGEIMTDMYYPVYAQGLYDSLVQAKELGVPVYITETGCADKSDKIRPLMIDEYVRATLRAMKDGVDVRGFYYWVSFFEKRERERRVGEREAGG